MNPVGQMEIKNVSGDALNFDSRDESTEISLGSFTEVGGSPVPCWVIRFQNPNELVRQIVGLSFGSGESPIRVAWTGSRRFVSVPECAGFCRSLPGVEEVFIEQIGTDGEAGKWSASLDFESEGK